MFTTALLLKNCFDNRFKAVTPFLLTVCGVRFGIDHFILLTYVLFSSLIVGI